MENNVTDRDAILDKLAREALEQLRAQMKN